MNIPTSGPNIDQLKEIVARSALKFGICSFYFLGFFFFLLIVQAILNGFQLGLAHVLFAIALFFLYPFKKSRGKFAKFLDSGELPVKIEFRFKKRNPYKWRPVKLVKVIFHLNNNDRIFVSVDENEFSHFFELISKVYPGVPQVFDERSKELLNN